MSNDDAEEMANEEKIWVLNQRLRQLKFEQLTTYFKAWVIATEFTIIGVSVVWVGFLLTPPYGISEFVADTRLALLIAGGVILAITPLIRITWIVVTGSLPAFGNVTNWKI